MDIAGESSPSERQGFSILELIVALFVLTTLMTTVLGIFAQVDYLSDRSSDQLRANTLAFEKIQTYENRSFDNLTAGILANSYQVEDFSSTLPSQLKGPKTGKVFIKDISLTLKRVDVQIVYQDRRVERTVNYSTLIQESGLGR